MRFLRYLENCFNKCQADRLRLWEDYKHWLADESNKGKPYPYAYDQQVAEERKDAIDYILAFMGSAIDHTYKCLPGGFKNNLPNDLKECFEVFVREYHEHGYLLGLRSAASHLNMSIAELNIRLNRIDNAMRFLAQKEVKAIMKLDNDLDIKKVSHYFKMNVQQNKEIILNPPDQIEA
jgi:hypothetical protein